MGKRSLRDYNSPLAQGVRIPLSAIDGVNGDLIYVDSVLGSDIAENGSAQDHAYASLSKAVDRANAYDTIVLMPNHTETLTAALTISKAGLHIIGAGRNMARANFNGNAAADVLSISGANVTLENLAFPLPGIDDQTADVNINAAGVALINSYHIGSTTSKNKTDLVTITASGSDFLIEGMNAYNTVVDCVSAISIEGAAARGIIRECNIQGQFSTGVLMDEATSTLNLIENNLFKNTKAATAVVTFTTGNSTGVMRFNHLSGRHTTIASNLVAGTGMDFFENRVVEEAALNGAILPTADAD